MPAWGADTHTHTVPNPLVPSISPLSLLYLSSISISPLYLSLLYLYLSSAFSVLSKLTSGGKGKQTFLPLRKNFFFSLTVVRKRNNQQTEKQE